MTILRSMAFAALLISTVRGALADETQPGANATTSAAAFKGTARLVDVVESVEAFSSDKQAVTVLFSNLEASVGSGRGPLIDTRSITVSLPLEVGGKEAHLTQDIRGYVALQEGAKAALVVQAAGEATVIDLEKAIESDRQADVIPATQQTRKRAHRLAEEAQFDDDKTTRDTNGSFFHRISATVPAGTSYRVTFFLLVERHAEDESGAYLVIDSLDVALVEQKPDRNKAELAKKVEDMVSAAKDWQKGDDNALGRVKGHPLSRRQWATWIDMIKKTSTDQELREAAEKALAGPF